MNVPKFGLNCNPLLNKRLHKFCNYLGHCVDAFKAEKIQVWLNEEDFRVEDETLTGTLRIDVEEIIMHQDYDRNKIKNDIAVSFKKCLRTDFAIFKGVFYPAFYVLMFLTKIIIFYFFRRFLVVLPPTFFFNIDFFLIFRNC